MENKKKLESKNKQIERHELQQVVAIFLNSTDEISTLNNNQTASMASVAPQSQRFLFLFVSHHRHDWQENIVCSCNVAIEIVIKL